MSSPEEAAAAAPAEPRLGWYARFKKAAKALKKEVLAVYYAIHDPRTPWYAKLLPFFVLAYALSPLDLIPDFIPVLGILDDLVLLPGLILLAMKLIPKQVMEDARARAQTEPLRLSRNWVCAVFVFALWLGAIEWATWFSLQRYGSPEVQAYQLHILGGIAGGACLVFVLWLVLALRQESKKRAGKHKKGKSGAAGTAGAAGVEQGAGEGLTEPLLARADGAGGADVEQGAVSQG